MQLYLSGNCIRGTFGFIPFPFQVFLCRVTVEFLIPFYNLPHLLLDLFSCASFVVSSELTMRLKWHHHVIFVLRILVFTILYSVKGVYYKIFGNRSLLKEEDEEVMEGEVVVITGANRGIGKQTALEFAKRGAVVVFGCRNVNSAQEAIVEIRTKTGNDKLDAFPLDLMDLDSVERFSIQVAAKYPKIKMLINNAGLTGVECSDPNELTKDGFNPTMAANYFGHFLLTNLLLANLQSSSRSRVIVITSAMQLFAHETIDLEDLNMQESGFGFLNLIPYFNSKFCSSLFTTELAKRMEREVNGLTVVSVCPGAVQSGIVSQTNKLYYYGFKLFANVVGMSCKQAVSEFILDICLSKKLGYPEAGLIYQIRRPCRRCNLKLQESAQLREKLWDVSAKLVKLEERLKKP